MARFLKDRKQTQGKVPGTLMFIGKKKVSETTADYFRYDEKTIDESQVKAPDFYWNSEEPQAGVHWINFTGLHDVELIRKIGREFRLHSLLLESVLNTGTRPHTEEIEAKIFTAVKMMRFDDSKARIVSEQISFVLIGNVLITFQEEESGIFDAVRVRIRENRGRVRRYGADYLLFALLDVIFDHYIFAVEEFGLQIEDLEMEVLKKPSPQVLQKINLYKLEINYLRKNVRPARELAVQLSKTESSYFRKGTYKYLNDLVKNATQASEVVESYAAMLTDFLQVYHSSVTVKMNEVMKVLTIFTAIFIPLSFIAGVYGMNFEFFPELKFKYSYAIFWVIMIVISLIMFRYFRKKQWL